MVKLPLCDLQVYFPPMKPDVNTTVTFRSLVDRATSDCHSSGSGGGGGVGDHGSPPLLALAGWVALSWYAIVIIVSSIGYIQM